MGATTFSQTEIGTDAQAAFRQARERAAWEHGHGGYTGSIAEKVDFQVFDIPARADAGKVIGWALTAERYDAEWMGKPKRGSGLRLYQSAYGVTYQMDSDVPPALRDLVAKIADATSDKWGPAGAIELKGKQAAEIKADYARRGFKVRGRKVYVFFGWASC